MRWAFCPEKTKATSGHFKIGMYSEGGYISIKLVHLLLELLGALSS